MRSKLNKMVDFYAMFYADFCDRNRWKFFSVIPELFRGYMIELGQSSKAQEMSSKTSFKKLVAE